ncbi:MAG: ABC transporter substrate-binding protein [Christensenellaceae bacterium]|jgi:branched-chain amino acid transport system substrate-binding protein|nr:ABC transporter substrate-binding protein [Christensenellaceae bacterium]
MSRKSVIAILLVLAFALTAAAGCAAPTADVNNAPTAPATSSEEDVIKIGVVSPLTGGTALMGAMETEGFNLALDEINAKGGVLGKQLKIIQLDDSTTPEGGVSGVRQLIEQEKVAIITGCSNSQIALAEKEITRDRIFQFVTGAQVEAITSEGHKWLVNGNSTVFDYASGLGHFLLDKFQPKRVGIYVENTDWGHDSVDIFTKIVEEEYPDVEIVCTVWYSQSDADLTSSLTQVKAANPDLIYTMAALMSQIPQVYKQMNELGMDSIIRVHTSGQIISSVIEASDGLMEGIYTADLYHHDIDNEMNKEFVKKFIERYGYPPEKISALAYMDLIISAQAIEEAGSPTDYDKIVEIIKSRPWPSVMSNDMDFDETGRSHVQPVLLQVVNGQLEMVK